MCFGDRSLFGVPDEITDITRSLGHNEKSRNGREVKIHILEGSIRTSEWFREVRIFYRSTEGLPEPIGGINGPTWALVEREGPQGVPPMAVRIGLGGGGGAPLSLSLSFLFPSGKKGKRGGESY